MEEDLFRLIRKTRYSIQVDLLLQPIDLTPAGHWKECRFKTLALASLHRPRSSVHNYTVEGGNIAALNGYLMTLRSILPQNNYTRMLYLNQSPQNL